MEIKGNMRDIVDKLNKASDAYYNNGTEIMTNYEWDELFDGLKRLEEQTGVIFSDSPTQRVGSSKNAGQKEKHEFSALSLAKSKNVDDLIKWASGKPIWLSWKLDGSTIVVTYDNGFLTKVLTRGDGTVGTNITHLRRAIKGLPESIPYNGHLVVRGEAIISYSDFNRYVKETNSDAANPRNLAAGSLNAKYVEDILDRNVQFRPFTLVYTSQDDEEKGKYGQIKTGWGERMDILEEYGFTPVEREYIYNPSDISSLIESEKWNPENYDFPVDGLVITYDDTDYAAGGSVTGHHATRAGFAFKWADEVAETTLDHIEWSCAATAITPVAVFDPVELEGTTVRRASLHNVSECKRIGIGDKGTKLSVIKANKIIPMVVSAEKVGGFIIPKKCPVCGADTSMIFSKRKGMPDVEVLTCTNNECAAKNLKKFSRYVSKDGMDIDGLSESKIKDLIAGGYISGIVDLYKLHDEFKETGTIRNADGVRLSSREGWGSKSVSNLVKSIEKSKVVDEEHFLYALFIPMCGHDVSKKLLNEYGLCEILRKAVEANKNENYNVFEHIDGIGPEKSEAFVKWFTSENRAFIKEIVKNIRIKSKVKTENNNSCEGLTFVVTGKVYDFKNRAELKTFIEDRGGKVAGSVSKKTDYLIQNDVDESNLTDKAKKARELGTEILSEAEFIEKFGK